MDKFKCCKSCSGGFSDDFDECRNCTNGDHFVSDGEVDHTFEDLAKKNFHTAMVYKKGIKALQKQLDGYRKSVFNTLHHCGSPMNFTFGTPDTPEKYNCQKCDVEIIRDITKEK